VSHSSSRTVPEPELPMLSSSDTFSLTVFVTVSM
jgi:hypothetical protein